MKKTPTLILLVVLVLVGVVFVVWYMLQKTSNQAIETASSTFQTASTTPTNSQNGVQHLTESNQYYTIDLQYPTQTPLAQTAGTAANNAAVAAFSAWATQSRDSFISDGDLASMTPETFAQIGGHQEDLANRYTLYQGAGTITYVFDTYADTGGAHPNSYYNTFTFDAKTGAKLGLSDLFTSGSNYLDVLSKKSRAALTVGQDGEGMDGTMLLDGTTPKAENFQNFAIDGSDFVLFFPPYQVAAYAAGPQTVRIPLSELNSILKSAYK